MDEKEIWERLTSVESAVKSAHHRLNLTEKLTQSVSDMVVEVKHMREDINNMHKELDEVKNRPLRLYDKLLWSVAGAGISGIISLIFSYVN